MQLPLRNDRAEDVSTEALIARDAEIIAEDRDALQSPSPDAVADISRRIEMRMPSDWPGLLIRKRLRQPLNARGETEVPGPDSARTAVADGRWRA